MPQFPVGIIDYKKREKKSSIHSSQVKHVQKTIKNKFYKTLCCITEHQKDIDQKDTPDRKDTTDKKDTTAATLQDAFIFCVAIDTKSKQYFFLNSH